MPGLVDNVAQGVRRSKITLTGPEISTIFRPVLQEIVALVNGLIASTRRTVKAVLLVGVLARVPTCENPCDQQSVATSRSWYHLMG